jgi:RNA polymerase-binding transcription factor DksA
MNKSNHSPKVPQERGRSSTLDILGAANGKKVPGRWAEQHRRLTELRERILREKKAQTESAQAELCAFSEHMADAATDSYDHDCALALLSSAQEALYEVEQALHRIDKGSYGICEMSGDRIEAERLKAIPWTRFSLTAQAQLEARGGANRIQLGELGSCLKAGQPPGSEEDEADETPSGHQEAQAA